MGALEGSWAAAPAAAAQQLPSRRRGRLHRHVRPLKGQRCHCTGCARKVQPQHLPDCSKAAGLRPCQVISSLPAGLLPACKGAGDTAKRAADVCRWCCSCWAAPQEDAGATSHASPGAPQEAAAHGGPCCAGRWNVDHGSVSQGSQLGQPALQLLRAVCWCGGVLPCMAEELRVTEDIQNP